jgi:hypothetical protein
MGQNSQTGAEADHWGRSTARLIAMALGAMDLSSESNERTLNGARVVIKTVGAKTTNVGVTYRMLDHIQSVIGAFQQPDGSFELFSLPAKRMRSR